MHIPRQGAERGAIYPRHPVACSSSAVGRGPGWLAEGWSEGQWAGGSTCRSLLKTTPALWFTARDQTTVSELPVIGASAVVAHLLREQDDDRHRVR